jgi:hypothetical protein
MATRTILGLSLSLGVLAAACGSSNAAPPGNPLPADPPAMDGFGPRADAGATCVGLECNQVYCGATGTTSLSGKVYDPSGTVPLYNAIVYIPNAELAPFVPGITCDQCGTAPSGSPIATALTDAKGDFTLKNVPVGVDVPVVVQIGRWRRKVTIPASSVNMCADTKLGVGTTRLPRSKAEGDIPKIAITTGGSDSLECFVRKLGVETEMTNPSGAGRVHLYQGKNSEGAVGENKDGSTIDASTPAANVLWDDAAKLESYDIVILACEGSENAATKSPTARANLKQYLDKGGRLFASHYHYEWFKHGVSPLPSTATWSTESTSDTSSDVSIDTTFAKGVAFSSWLDEVGATTAPKSGIVTMTALRTSVTQVPGASGAVDESRRWLYTPTGPKFFSFNTPIGTPPAQQCGRGVFTDIHVSSGDLQGGTFPANCTTTGFTAQEKALLFLMMDLASCIQDDKMPPAPPPPVK